MFEPKTGRFYGGECVGDPSVAGSSFSCRRSGVPYLEPQKILVQSALRFGVVFQHFVKFVLQRLSLLASQIESASTGEDDRAVAEQIPRLTL